VREIGGPLIEGFYPTSADAGVTLPGVRRFVIIVAIGLGLAYVIGVPAFLERDDDPLPRKADAIVVLAGSDGPVPAGEALFRRKIAPMLVVSGDRSSRDPARAALCRKPPRGVVCIETKPYATLDAARIVDDLAQRHHWSSIVLVAPQYSLFRTSRIFDRCVDANVAEQGVDEPWWRNAIAVPLEWIKLGISETVRRNC
jgi:uncharacterized SAM-binding protein YcdF (DUF218 family)